MKRANDTSSHDPTPKKPKVDPPSADSPIAAAFETFSNALSSLLSHPDHVLAAALPSEKAQFLSALQSMKSDLTWLPDPPPIPSSTSDTAAAYPPTLPPIFSTSLRLQAFTHRSYILGEHASLPGASTSHYERLEFLGDAFLQSLSSHLLHMRFPSEREGSLSSMRQTLVCNATLAKYANLYNFSTHLRTAPGMLDRTNSQTRTKTLGDVFEAYIGALVVERGPDEGARIAREWMMRLWEPEVRELEMRRAGEQPPDKMAKQKLAVACGGNLAKLEYVWQGGGGGNKGGYWIEVKMTGWGWEGRVLARGWGHSKGDAQLRAAMNALADTAFVAEMAELKAKHLAKGKPPPSITPSSSTTESTTPTTTTTTATTATAMINPPPTNTAQQQPQDSETAEREKAEEKKRRKKEKKEKKKQYQQQNRHRDEAPRGSVPQQEMELPY